MDTILLVNDSPTLTKLLSAHFQKAGYKVVCAATAMDAYEGFIRNEVHLILLDNTLKDRDGISVAQTFRARKHSRALPIVMFIATEDPALAEQCTTAGANLVLAKSNGPASLIEKVGKLVEDAKLNQHSTSFDAELGHGIIKSTTEVFRTMLNTKVTAGAMAVEKAKSRQADVIASIGVTGFFSGAISVFMDKPLAQQVAAGLLGLDAADAVPEQDVIDAIGELVNMIGGNVKNELFTKMPLFDISVPSVYVGDGLQRRAVADDLCFTVPFQVNGRDLTVEFLMNTNQKGGTGVQQSVLAGKQ